jgi:hypothetical protein
MEGEIMQATMYAVNYAAPVSSARMWGGRIMSGFAILFLLFDGMIKVFQLPAAVDGSVQFGYRAGLTPVIGALLLSCLAVYAIPRTAPFGALLLTGYLGGAVATQVRAESPVFSLIFPVLLGAIIWGGLMLRDRRVRILLSQPA